MSNAPLARSFYDRFTWRLVADHVYGNARFAQALRFVLAHLPADATRVLDIGCGVGASSHAIAQALPHARVVGLDLSPENIRVARALFDASGISFHVQDVSAAAESDVASTDAAVMIDVLEHIPDDDRAAFVHKLARWMKPNARLIFTFPSVHHQGYLRAHRPEGLQPVDEDLSRAVIDQVADLLGGRLTVWHEISVWNPGDYVHAVIERGTVAASPPKTAQVRFPVTGRLRRVRLQKVAHALGFRVTPEGLPVRALATAPRIALVAPKLDAITETFIREHLACLPFDIRVLHGPALSLDLANESIVGHEQVSRAANAAWKWAAHSAGVSPIAVAHALWMRRHRIRAVLAEYGPTATALAPACKLAGIPLVAHFHGYDAFEHAVLREHEDRYRALVEQAAIVTVSQSMAVRVASFGALRFTPAVIPCGVDTESFAPTDASANPPVVLTVGRFVEKKAPHLSILAFARLAEQLPEIRLEMVGDGPLLPICRQLVTALGLADRVTFHGALVPPGVAHCMARARVFAQHSVVASNGDAEGTPVAVLEAMASALPVVATQHMGIAEVVQNGQTGRLVAEGDVPAMAAALCDYLTDPNLAAKHGAAGRRFAVKRLRSSTAIAQLAEVIESAIATAKRH